MQLRNSRVQPSGDQRTSRKSWGDTHEAGSTTLQLGQGVTVVRSAASGVGRRVSNANTEPHPRPPSSRPPMPGTQESAAPPVPSRLSRPPPPLPHEAPAAIGTGVPPPPTRKVPPPPGAPPVPSAPVPSYLPPPPPVLPSHPPTVTPMTSSSSANRISASFNSLSPANGTLKKGLLLSRFLLYQFRFRFVSFR